MRISIPRLFWQQRAIRRIIDDDDIMTVFFPLPDQPAIIAGLQARRVGDGVW